MPTMATTAHATIICTARERCAPMCQRARGSDAPWFGAVPEPSLRRAMRERGCGANRPRTASPTMHLEIMTATDPATRERAYGVRQRVFVEEQGVSQELEHDEHDAFCPHVLALLEGMPVGAARYRSTPNGIKIERVAVLAEQRARGVGARMVEHILAELAQGSVAYVHAQESALGFWARMGFAVEGDGFVEADIAHRTMFLRPQRDAFAITSVLAASPQRVWAHASSIEGISFELGPWLHMSVPRGTDARSLSDRLSRGAVSLPWSMGRAWLLLLGLVPFDWDDMTIVELQPGQRFLERSSML